MFPLFIQYVLKLNALRVYMSPLCVLSVRMYISPCLYPYDCMFPSPSRYFVPFMCMLNSCVCTSMYIVGANRQVAGGKKTGGKEANGKAGEN